MSARVIDYTFLRNLEEWVNTQRRVLETFQNVAEEVEKGDRLALIIATRMAFQHMMKTIKAFDNWLQDPVIISHLDKKMLLEVWTTMYEILQKLLAIDIKHTGEVKELLESLARENKLNPLVAIAPSRGSEEEAGPGGMYR